MAQASECDSDETVIEGSVTENELEDEELPWRRLLLNRDTSFKSEFCLHSGVNGMWKGMPSPEIQLGLRFGKDSEEQKNKNKVMPTLSEDLVLQDPQDEATQNQVLLQEEFPACTLPFPHPEFSWSHRKTGGPEAENGENLPRPGKELSENTDSPEISLLSGTSLMASDLVIPKEKSLEKPVKTLAVPNTFFEPEQEVTQTMTSKETKDEESSLETFVSALERLLESPEGTQEETLRETANDFKLEELMNPLSSVSVPLKALPACCRDVLENTKSDDALPAELLATINMLPGGDVEPGPVGPICRGQEKSSSVSGGNGCLEVQPTVSKIDEDCTQIAQTIEDPKPFRLQTKTHENTTSYEQLNDKGNSDTVKNTSVQETPHVLRRSSRLEKLKASRDVAHTDVLKMPESITSKPLSYEDQIHNIFATENFRMQGSVLKTGSKRKNMHLSRFRSEQRKKNEQLKIKNGKRKMNKMCLCCIKRRNVFGEDLLYKAALHNDVDLVRCCIKNGGNLNQPSYADEEFTTNASRAERTVRNCREKEENVGSATHMPCDTQDHRRDQNFRERKGSLKAPCSQVAEVNTAGIRKRNAKGESLLHVASRGGDLSLVKVLIASGADVNIKDNTGWTPLHEASSEGFNDVIVELLKAGANINCENVDGMLPLHGAAVGNHLKTAEILLEHGANPNQKDQKQRTALEKADDEKMKDLLRSYGAVETSHGDEISSTVAVKHPALRPKRYKPCPCDDGKAIAPPSSLHKAKRSENLPAHQTISAILQDIEEKQENLLKLEIRDSEDAEQYIGKMLEIKEVMDDILAQQKTERDDLAKKYRVSMESFKHGALREQLSNLATRQKRLLVVAKKQKKIRLKIQNYKNSKPLSGIRKRTCSSDISSEKKSRESPSLKNSVYPQSDLLSPVSLAAISPVNRNMEEIPLSMEMEIELSGNEMNSKQNVQYCALDGLLKSRLTDGTEKSELSSQPVAFVPQAGNSQAESLTETLVKGYELDGSPAVTGTVSISEDKSMLSQNDACPPTVPQNLDLSCCNPKRRNKKAASDKPSVGASEPLAHQVVTVLDTDIVQHANSVPIPPSSGSARQQPIKKTPHHSTAPKKKNIQLKDLLLRGRINTGKDILEFKTQETTHKASILLNGKLKVENGQIYQNPVTWLKDLLGGGNYVTWNYAWSKVTYLGKELLKYVSEEEPVPPEPCNTPQQQQPCLPDTSRKSVQSFPHYLQIKEILSISDQELLPSHVMEQHWKFYVECKTLPF
ncbi:ankyrin repeat domain-containing protein 31 isoform X9 [Arvicola amphibius]|uniref:ankyrin repeat domain-containing protein 31 isoform X9 n=1 Tax=Arvicola amphibius TaxID=1047088 RepID=UPI0018E2DC4B|nr:ankyrin repeat domain-containing protein 31 isoform X9 [Arvicola amphibius]